MLIAWAPRSPSYTQHTCVTACRNSRSGCHPPTQKPPKLIAGLRCRLKVDRPAQTPAGLTSRESQTNKFLLRSCCHRLVGWGVLHFALLAMLAMLACFLASLARDLGLWDIHLLVTSNLHEFVLASAARPSPPHLSISSPPVLDGFSCNFSPTQPQTRLSPPLSCSPCQSHFGRGWDAMPSRLHPFPPPLQGDRPCISSNPFESGPRADRGFPATGLAQHSHCCEQRAGPTAYIETRVP